MRALYPGDFKLSDTIHGAILNVCSRESGRVALVADGGEGRQYTYGDISRLVGGVAGILNSDGLKRGDRIAIFAENRPEWPIVYLAILAAGCVVVPFDPVLKERELVNFLRGSEVSAIFCSRNLFERVDKAIVLNDLQIKVYDMDGIPLFNQDYSGRCKVFLSSEVSSQDTAALIYTSGTTSAPKGVILTHGNLLANIHATFRALEMYDDDVFLSVLPLHHTFEATCGFLFPLFVGLKIVYARSLKSRDIINDIMNNNITCMVGVPLLYEKIFNAVNRRIKQQAYAKRILFGTFLIASKLGCKIDKSIVKGLFRGFRAKSGLGSMRMFVCGGAPLPSKVAEWFNLIGFQFLQGYGLTECSPVVSVNRFDDIRFDSVGPPLPGVDVAIERPSRDGVGEIKVKGDNVTPGYIDNPEATAELVRDGWLYTGDMGKIKRGHLYITGRLKNVIVSSGGKNIYPEEIEMELNLSDGIKESLVLERKKPGRNDGEIWAIIVPDLEQIAAMHKQTGETIPAELVHQTVEREVARVNHHLADYKRIARFEIQTEEFRKTSSKKIRRNLYT
jgi:long-chain acyl-CoA synthetase